LVVLGDKLIFFANQTGNNNDEIFVLHDPSVSTTEARNETTFHPVPNPAKAYFTLHSETALGEGQLLRLYSMKGQLIRSWDMNTISQKFDCTNIPTGCYTLQWNGNDGSSKSTKIVIE
jgi:Secretion system C-terminal sorting domain